MARVNIEETVFSEGRVFHAATLLETSQFEVLGRLAYLWHDSQSCGRDSGTAREIGMWARLGPSEVDRWLKVFIEVGYLSICEKEKNIFVIHGNKNHIKSLRSYQNRAKKAAKLRHKTSRKAFRESIPIDIAPAPSMLQACSEQTGAELKQSPRSHNTIQYNSIQFNTKQYKEKEKELIKRPRNDSKEIATAHAAAPPAFNPVGVYVESYKAVYGVRPELQKKDLGILQRLAKQISQERLNNLLRVYCQMTDSWFVKKHHDLVTFEANLNKIAYSLETGSEASADKIEAVKKLREDEEFKKQLSTVAVKNG